MLRPKIAVIPFLALLCGGIAVASASEPDFCPANLAHKSWNDLECIYRQAEPGHIPCGLAHGQVVYRQGSFLPNVKSAATGLLWKGKVFDAGAGTLINQWCGVKAIRAVVSEGPSWLDGKPAIIIDYSETSRVWSNVRDEMREIAPGVYLGAMYLADQAEPRLKLYFILRTGD
jgi:hypothetical protein